MISDYLNRLIFNFIIKNNIIQMNINTKTLYYFDPDDKDFYDHIKLYSEKIKAEQSLLKKFKTVK